MRLVNARPLAITRIPAVKRRREPHRSRIHPQGALATAKTIMVALNTPAVSARFHANSPLRVSVSKKRPKVKRMPKASPITTKQTKTIAHP